MTRVDINDNNQYSNTDLVAEKLQECIAKEFEDTQHQRGRIQYEITDIK
jgi:hypothetical protein